MGAAGLDAALLVQRADIYYFSGTGQDAHLFVPVEGVPVLMARRSYERAAEESPVREVKSVSGLQDIAHIVHESFGSIGRLGMELDVLPVNNFRLYEKRFPEAEICDVSPLIKTLRMIKSSFELSLIREAAAMNDAMFAYVPEVLREGMTEIQLAGALEHFLRDRGHQGLVRVRSFNNEVFYGHVMSGPNLAVPSCSVGPTGGAGPSLSFPQGAGHRRIQRNEPVQIDFVGMAGGYMADQARTFYLGEAPKKLAILHERALEIQEYLVKATVPGATAGDVYETAAAMASKVSHGEGFMGFPSPVPFVGHGVGLELDEWPILGKNISTKIEKGMVIACEPKFIVPAEGLAGIENTFVVNDYGLERLTLHPDAIQSVS
jgi:Xaa-Pro aminopeptidase